MALFKNQKIPDQKQKASQKVLKVVKRHYTYYESKFDQKQPDYKMGVA